MALRPNGKIYPCCVYQEVDEHRLPDDLTTAHPDPFNHPYMTELRERMLRDEYIPNCQKCYNDERIYGSSMRKDVYHAGAGFGLPEDETLGVVPVLTNIDMTFSNVCNNRCRMCQPSLSTRWYNDARKLGFEIPSGVVARNSIIEDSDLSTLRYVKILGGEPLMEQESLKRFLSKCTRSQLGVLFVTNCTLLPDDETFALLKECDVTVNLSIDAYGPLNDFLRKDSVWDTVNRNLHWYHNNFDKVSVHSVCNIYSVNKIHELIEHVNSVDENIFHDVVLIGGPPYMQPRHLPEHVKEYLQNYASRSIVQYPRNEKIFKLIQHELKQQGNFKEFVMHDKQLNTIRNEHWQDKNPELWNLIKEEYEYE